MALCWDLPHPGWSTERADAAVAAFQTLATRPGELTPADQLLYSNVQMFRSQYAWDLTSKQSHASRSA